MIKVVKEFIKHKNEYFFYLLFLVAAALFCTVALEVFLEITEDLKADELVKVDSAVTDYIHGFRSETLTAIVVPITEMGSQWAYMIVIPIIAFLLYKRGKGWYPIVPATIILISSFLLNLWIKYLISRPRPIEDMHLVEVGDASFSYPSGHSMSAIAFYGFLIYLTFRYVKSTTLKWALIVFQALLILGIGTSRVYLGVHYPTDVVAGFVAGLIWLAVCIVAIKTIALYRRKRQKSN